MAALEATGKWASRGGARKMEVWVDGGVRRGTDVFKALALGADAVGIGKPAVFAMSAFGAEGISRVVGMLEDELIQTMRLCGTQSLRDIKPELVDTSGLSHRPFYPLPPPPPNMLAFQNAKEETAALRVRGGGGGGGGAVGETGVLGAFAALMMAVLRSLAKPFFLSATKRAAISSSAVFLIAFTIIHVAGNLSALASPNAFNAYAHKLHSLGPLLTLIEGYLFGGFLVHVGVGLYITYTDKKVKLDPNRFSWASARLALSGLVVLAFVVTHVQHFRFGTWYWTKVDGVRVRDLWKLQVEVFTNPAMVAWYCLATLVLGKHMLFGWQKTVRKPEGLGPHLPKPVQPHAEAIGNALTYLIVASFIACPLYTHYLVREGTCFTQR